MMFPAGFWWGLAVGLGASLAVGLALWWLIRSRSIHAVTLLPPEAGDSASGPNPFVPAGSRSSATPPTMPPSPREDDLPMPGARAIAAHDAVTTAEAPRSSEAPLRPVRPHYSKEQLRTSLRILLHLSHLGSAGPGEIPTRACTQSGMVEALGVTQGALTSALSRLVSGGLVEVERSHVVGSDRRLKVYRLTPRGRSLAVDLRRRNARGPEPSPVMAAEPVRRVTVQAAPTPPSG